MRIYLSGCLTLFVFAACASAGVVATNAEIPAIQLVGPDNATAGDPAIFLYDGFTRTHTALDIGTYNPYIQMRLTNGSNITSTGIVFLGGDYPNKVGESGDPDDYPGHQALVIDNSTMTVPQFRIGSKNSHNTMILQNHATMAVTGGMYIDMYDNVEGNAAIVTGGAALTVTGGRLFVGYGNSANESLTVTDGGTVAIGTTGAPQRLEMRYSHDSFVRVSGADSTLTVTDQFRLGTHGGYCYNNRLTIENDGEVWLENESTPLTVAYNASLGASRIELAAGRLVAKGDHTGNTTIGNLIDVWDGTQYLDATAGDAAIAGQYDATYYTEGDYAGYTVFTGGSAIPEPATMTLLGIGGLLMARRRK